MTLETVMKRLAELYPVGLGPGGRHRFDLDARQRLEDQAMKGDPIARTLVAELVRHERLIEQTRQLPAARNPVERERVTKLLDDSITRLQLSVQQSAITRLDAIRDSTKAGAENYIDARSGTDSAVSRTRLHREELTTRYAGLTGDELGLASTDLLASSTLDPDEVDTMLAELRRRSMDREADTLRAEAVKRDYSRPWMAEANEAATRELGDLDLYHAVLWDEGKNMSGRMVRVPRKVEIRDLIAVVDDRPVDARLARIEAEAAAQVKMAPQAADGENVGTVS